jgi:hypothetical protein
VVPDQRGGGAYGETYQPHVDEKGTFTLSVVAALTTITACVVSCMILVARPNKVDQGQYQTATSSGRIPHRRSDNFEKK